MTYTNPLTAKNHPHDHYGDPYVFRYQGRYYLFVSTPDGACNIRVFISDDLVNWEYHGDACSEPLLEAAYAPEIIYAYNRFYLITSPKGHGHYIYVADKPEGPYTRLTDNVNSMIDGSFFVGPDGILHLLRADHAGIALLDVSVDGHLFNRRNLGTHLNAWTEGPSLFYRDGYYYLTYCGNHLLSKGYRIAYATSKRFDGEYVPGINNPLLINTNEGYTRLGHSSSVLGPDLDGWYIVYHTMEQGNDHYLPRKFMIDRLRFSNRLMHASSSDFEIISPVRPRFETHQPHKDLLKEGSMILSSLATGPRFTLEASFKGIATSLITSYKNPQQYVELCFEQDLIRLIKHQNGTRTITTIANPFDFTHFHTVRIINDKTCEILIDNAPIAKVEPLPPGRIGYQGRGEYAYTAFNDHANGSSDCHYQHVLPGIIDVSHRCPTNQTTIDPVDEIPALELTDDRYEYVTKDGGSYALFIYAKLTGTAKLKVNAQLIELTPIESEYAYTSYFLGYFSLEKLGTLSLSIIKGKISYKFLTLDKAPYYKPKCSFIKQNEYLTPHSQKDSFFLAEDVDWKFDLSVNFTIETLRPYDLFGLLLQTRQYSNEYPQARLPLLGYLVGFEGGLLIIDKLNYGRQRIYDRPTDIHIGKTYNLRTSLVNGKFAVYLDGQLLITTTISEPAYLGGYGAYASSGSSLKLSDLIKHDERR